MSARSSTALFRTALRPAFASRSAIAPFSTTAAARDLTYKDKDNLRGPGGQQPPPQKPGGPEALKRNWMVIGGAALALLIGYNVFAKNPEEAKKERDKALAEVSGRKKTPLGGFRTE